jgi:Fic family protein
MSRGRPSRQQVLDAFDRSLADLAAVGGLPLPIEAEGIWQNIWHEETHHSTAIEGNTLVLRQVKTLLEEGRAVGNKELREYLEIEGYADGAKWVYRQAIRGGWSSGVPRAELINMTELREIHRLVMEPAWGRFPPEGSDRKEGPGGLRVCELQPLRPGLAPPMSVEVPALLTDWIDLVNRGASQDTHFMIWLAEIHAGFERIHPFRDGNGRVGRLLLNLLLVRYGAPPAIIYKRDRTKYLKALGRADKGDAGPLAELLARAVRHSVERHVLPALAGPMRLVPLGALATDDLSRLALLSAAKRERLQAVRLSDAYYSTRQWVDEYAASRQRGRRHAA